MTKPQIRYGAGNADKIRGATITAQQIAELAVATGKSKVEVVQEAISFMYDAIVAESLRKQRDGYKNQVELLEAELARLVNL